MTEWKDCTSYRRGVKERIPTTWELDMPSVRISITCGHIHHPGEWIMHCAQANMNTVSMQSQTLEGAKAEAVMRVKSHFQNILAEIEQATA